MSNSNTRRRKAKKRARGKALAWPFAGIAYSGVRGPGKSTLQRIYEEALVKQKALLKL